ncbi:hypothetical protein MBM_03125 [Drepanopeziza brunnea f. sp. 'multigermtubi' MB_m1]|uniref:Uncharacterized protein n=1 Tax=Marssonina brunnea f. sp. multigermtubi (strain MB_m1) TaxID=1072389 RepID=K1XDD9_MARBU|nr:uncharacterized protein MBM_03125 [Drepanopeziza brunnea f. sp. 'multigermtubi' MB_m1]EKD18883.1 hypothetical protein MBM_03125 [Drepanopeziza brunnea f. sp. 'multigermtubi' MB_m1]
MPLSTSNCAILLALNLLFNRAQGIEREIIGYRSVGDEEANLINSSHKPYRDRKYDENGEYLRQIGSGFYMTNEPAFWKYSYNHCVIKADSDKIENADKIYIPKDYHKLTSTGKIEENYLWNGDEKLLSEFIEKMILDPEKTLRFSWILHHGPHLQMVIPTDVLNNDDLDLWAECFESEKELLEYSSKIIDWDSWNIIGDPGLPSN